MNNKILCLLTLGFLFSVTVFSGCQQLLPGSPTIYVTNPTKITYTLTYGYWVNCTGSGRYEVTYLCDLPEALRGTVTAEVLYPNGYQNISQVNNTFVRWNLSGNDVQRYKLGVVAQVTTDSYLVNDLNGKNARSIQEIHTENPLLIDQYTRPQGNTTTKYIDPENPSIVAIVHEVRQIAKTNNSFLLAKAFFVWLKEHVTYRVHPEVEGVQPAIVTLQKGTGDCDDLSFLYISLCRAVGIPARFIRGYLITSQGNSTAIATAHAWSEVFVGESVGNSGWIPVESACVTTLIDTDVNQNFGVENTFHVRLFEDDGSDVSLATSLTGIAYVTYGMNREVKTTPFATVTNYQELELKKLVITADNVRYYE